MILFAMICFAGHANAAFSQVACTSNNDRIDYTYSGLYNHAWVYVNGGFRGDFWTISSGLGNFTTTLNKNDHVLLLWYNTDEGYDSLDAICS